MSEGRGGYSAMGSSRSRRSKMLQRVAGADDVAADHLDVRQHRLQVLAGAHGVAEAALEGRRVQDRRGAGGAIAADRNVRRLVHAPGGGEPEPEAQIDPELAGGGRVID